MKRVTTLLLTAVLLLALPAATAQAKSAAELLREGLYAEEVEGNLDAAIGVYDQIIADTTTPKNLTAQALLRAGMCHLKKHNEAKAREALQKLVNEYPDQTEIVEKAKPILAGLGDADPAALMPPETLAYLEIGSPGQQVATILNMLKGTPLENPFNFIGMKSGKQNAGGQNLMSNALLNPGVLAELQKVRGIGVGVQDIGPGTPAAIAVLFPGKCDALKGLLPLALASIGKTTDKLEGMECFTFGGGGGAAYDDTVVILVTPSPQGQDLLQWAVRQYKGRATQPSLASANRSFARISRQTRQQNALTLWLNVPEAYARLLKTLPANQVPPQLQTLDGLANLKSIDDIIVTLSLRETNIALEADVRFKPGYQSLAYSMIRTPSLNKAALKVVPADAVALISFTLGAAGTPQAQAASDQIKQATGLDLGADIFGNIEQISLFVVPLREPVPPPGPGVAPVAKSIVLALTGRDPERTQKLLMALLKMANLMAPETEQPPTGTSRFEIALSGGLRLFGHTNEANKTLVLSLNPQIVEQSVAAAQQEASVLNRGPLHDSLATLSPTASKLVVLNGGAALRIIEQNSTFSSDEEGRQTKQCTEELTKAFSKTTIRLLTNEAPDSFGIRLSLSDLPPIQQISGPIAQLLQLVNQAKAPGGPTPSNAPAEAAGLVGWWKLDESEGTKAADSSGHGHDAILHGHAKWQPSGGKIGGALELDGAHDYADTGYRTDLATWTVAVWVKSPSAPTTAKVPSGPVHREANYQINWDHHRDGARRCGSSSGVHLAQRQLREPGGGRVVSPRRDLRWPEPQSVQRRRLRLGGFPRGGTSKP